MLWLASFSLLLSLATGKLHDSDVPGMCSIDWDTTDEQLALDSSVCCDDAMQRQIYKTLDDFTVRKINASEVMEGVLAIAPDYNTHILVTDGPLAVGAPGPGPNFCKQRVGRLHVVVQSSPVLEPYASTYSLPIERQMACESSELATKVAEIVAKFKLPGRFRPAQMIRIFSRELYAHFQTRVWLSMSRARVAYHSNAQTVCEFAVGHSTLAVFTFQSLTSRR